MDKKDFMIGLKILKAFYINWPFNFNDRIQIDTWYEFLNEMNFDTFTRVINYYISKNNIGPNNPGELLRAKIELEIKDMINNGEPT